MVIETLCDVFAAMDKLRVMKETWTAISCHVKTNRYNSFCLQKRKSLRQIMYNIITVGHHLSLMPFSVHPLLVAVLFLYHTKIPDYVDIIALITFMWINTWRREALIPDWSGAVLCGPVYCGLTWQILREYDV